MILAGPNYKAAAAARHVFLMYLDFAIRIVKINAHETLSVAWTDFPVRDGQTKRHSQVPGVVIYDDAATRDANSFSFTQSRPWVTPRGTHALDGFWCQAARRLPE